MAITAAQVKALRERTGVGMMDCKAALQENGGDMEAAVDWLRKKGLAKAAKKAGRVAAEGLIGVAGTQNAAALVEVNSETDFVARNAGFQDAVRTIATVALATSGDLAALMAAGYPGTTQSVGDHLNTLIATIGENMSVRRSAALTVDEGVVSSYVHNAQGDGLGRIGVLVALRSSGDPEKLAAFARQLAMHVAAANPLALSPEDLDADVIARERAVFAEQARQSGKPDNIVEKMVEGRLRKFYEETTLLKQTFVIDNENSVQTAIANTAKAIGAPVELKGFVRFAVGEGIEKQADDFAAEVASMQGA